MFYPKKTDGTRFELADLEEDQRDVAAYVIKKVKEWKDYLESDDENKSFDPLRMTVLMGAAGTGKTVLINTLVTAVRDIFGCTGAAQVFAPTGCAAFNAGGETIHHGCGVPVTKTKASMDNEVTGKKRNFLVERFLETVLVIFDERSMISLDTMGVATNHVRQTARRGQHKREDWGGIPIVILLGDDYQLPPQMAKGPFDILGRVKDYTNNELAGRQVFSECAEDVMILTKKKRTQQGQDQFVEWLDAARVSKLSETQAKNIVDELSLNNFKADEVKTIVKDALFILANREPVTEYNIIRLKQVSSAENPVAVIRAVTSRGQKKGIEKHFGQHIPVSSLLCSGALVLLFGKNIRPRWGLFNGALDYVVKIVYRKGETPNNGDFPAYVIVDFPGYVGPVWRSENPTVRNESVECV